MNNLKDTGIHTPNINAYRHWKSPEVLSVTHLPKGSLALQHKSTGEGFRFRVSEADVANYLAKSLAGYIQPACATRGFETAVMNIVPEIPKAGIHPIHIIEYAKGMQPSSVGWTSLYVIEGEKFGMEFIRESQSGLGLSFLLHEGMKHHRGELPKFMKWLYEQGAIPQIG